MSMVISYRMKSPIGADTEQVIAEEMERINDRWPGLSIRNPHVLKNKQGQMFLYFQLFGVV